MTHEEVPLEYKTSEAAIGEFKACIGLVDEMFGDTARSLSLKGHALEVTFRIQVGRITTIGAECEDETAYTFKYIPSHQNLCARLTKALQQPMMRRPIHNIGFKMESYGIWSFGRSLNKAQEMRDKFDLSGTNLHVRRAEWFKAFIEQEDVIDMDLRYQSMPRPFGPFWPANRFGYFIGRAQNHLWIMSSGLSNPFAALPDDRWENSGGLGCEVLLRCEPDRLDLTNWTMELLNSPEMTILETLCGTLVNLGSVDGIRDGIDRVSGSQIVELDYYKHTPKRPLKNGTPFVLTNAASFDICPKIPCLGPFSARPLIASLVPKDMQDQSADEISRALIANKTIGLLPTLDSKKGKTDIGL